MFFASAYAAFWRAGNMQISVIIPTLNEAGQIVAALQAARAAVPGAEFVVADCGSADGTAALAAPFAQVVQTRKGRARQMNGGAALASGDILLFLHADTRLPANAGAQIAAAMADPAVAGGAFAMRFDAEGWPYRMMEWSTTRRSHWRKIFTGDQAIFVRATVFRRLGGYADIALMEDWEFSERLRAAGVAITLTPPVLVSARRHRRIGPLRVLVSGWALQILYWLGFPPFALHRLYYGRMPGE
jgi:rSAM/selenodomain-associated transferase 2